MDDIYISFGLFEDLILNSQFGFGKDIDDIDKGRSTQVRMNSSNSYVNWNKGYSDSQGVRLKSTDSAPPFLYPNGWGNGDDVGTDFELETQLAAMGSYSYQKNKMPVIIKETETDESITRTEQTYQSGLLSTANDKELERIPLRELFINVEIIIEAFEQNDNVRKVINQILKTLNEKSFNLFSLKMVAGDTKDSEIKIVDENYLAIGEENNSYDEENFVFNIMNPNSIVKDYNLEFKLPSGNIGNMYAVQAGSHGDNIFSVKEGVINSKALSKQYGDSLSIIYEPDLGSFRLKQLLDTKNESDVYNVYNQVNKLLKNNVYNVDTAYQNNQEFIEGTSINVMISGDAIPEKGKTTKKTKKVSPQDLIRINIENQEAVGIKVAENLEEYYQYITGVEIVRKTPRLLPYTLSLTTYGIASVQPGDTFEVDYLPKMYLKNSYLQIMKVTHDVGTDGWYTTFDTQFRLKSYVASREEIPDQQIRLSPNYLASRGFGEWAFDVDDADSWSSFFGFHDGLTLNQLIPYLTDFKVIQVDGFDIVLECKTTQKLSEDLPKNSTLVHAVGQGNSTEDYERNFWYQITGTTTDEYPDWWSDAISVKVLYAGRGGAGTATAAKDVELYANNVYRFYITGKRLMMLRMSDSGVKNNIEKIHDYFGNYEKPTPKIISQKKVVPGSNVYHQQANAIAAANS